MEERKIEEECGGTLWNMYSFYSKVNQYSILIEPIRILLFLIKALDYYGSMLTA